MSKNIKHIKTFILTYALVLFTFSINAQEVRVVNNKGTIQTVNNNTVTTSTTTPTNPVENDVWFDTTNNQIKIYDTVDGWKLITSTLASQNIYTANGNLTANRTLSGVNNFGLTLENLNYLQLFSNNSIQINGTNSTQISSGDTMQVSAGTSMQLTAPNNIILQSPTEFNSTLLDVNDSAGTSGQILSSTGTGVNWINNPALDNWLITGNTGTNSSTNFLGTIDDVRMQIRSNNTPILEFGRRATLNLVQSYPDYDDPDQPLMYLRGNNSISALQFAASGASFYKPMFYTTTNGSFRLKGSSGNTDLFEIGSAGPANEGRLEFIVGDDGNEPMIFKRYFYSPQIYKEFFRVQGSTTGRYAKTRFGININQQEIPISGDINVNYNNGSFNIANSTLQVQGSISKSTLTTTNNLTLTEDHYSIIINGNHTITLPNASTCEGREYVLKNITSNSINISSYRNLSNVNTSLIEANTVLKIQSNGSNWHQINNSATTTSGGATSTLTYIDKYNNVNSTVRVNDFNTNGTLIPLNSVRLYSGPINNRNNSQVQITETGLYEITYTVSLRKENGNDFNNRTNNSFEIVVCQNNNPIPNTGSIVTLIGNTNQRYVSASRTVLLNLTAYQSYGIKIREKDINNSGDVVIDANATGMTIKKIN
ncbi:hypothetical protein [Tenacibaculum discolor]|uniref:Uncharacterized protein n=1 Tax=Tenacibaculum discolor TaxID=361581 RepID=A0A2G1BYM6_9FLAO|nr:hypothetical protein [Tenacibaculum discolor]MDP2541432.1 hypothetical protein [Tenacibaculum discolor]PHN99116.1 hypothetical protein CSC81_00405 [Tenacibaculum discolor]PHO00121.1 hypothetical protein CSC82_30495 [Rhodobacteraceae bacterium 4F10]RLJ99758.1 hypothetical protein C8N27_2427 [Tenacibaculum discolor]